MSPIEKLCAIGALILLIVAICLSCAGCIGADSQVKGTCEIVGSAPLVRQRFDVDYPDGSHAAREVQQQVNPPRYAGVIPDHFVMPESRIIVGSISADGTVTGIEASSAAAEARPNDRTAEEAGRTERASDALDWAGRNLQSLIYAAIAALASIAGVVMLRSKPTLGFGLLASGAAIGGMGAFLRVRPDLGWVPMAGYGLVGLILCVALVVGERRTATAQAKADANKTALQATTKGLTEARVALKAIPDDELTAAKADAAIIGPQIAAQKDPVVDAAVKEARGK